MSAIVWKVLGTGSAVVTGIAAKKIVSAAWRKGTGSEPPANPESPDTTWGEALVWAVVSGALVGVARMLAARKAASFFRKSTGHLPKGIQDVG